MPLSKDDWAKLLLLFAFAGILVFQVYFVERPSFLVYFFNYLLLFCLFFISVAKHSAKELVQFSLFFYSLILFAVPELSNDFYRFLWDGELLHLGINPYDFLPSELIHQKAFSSPYFHELYNGMGDLSQHAYSPYPIVNQAFFYLATFTTKLVVNVLFLRIELLAGIYLLYYLLRKLVTAKQQSPKWAVLFLLNPFTILEFAVNLHFEIWMLIFFLYSLWLLQQNKIVIAAFWGAISIQLKLIPLVFYPALWRSLPKRTNLLFYLFSFLFSSIIGLALFDTVNLHHFIQTITWYFNKFEFNGGIYFLARSFAYLFSEFNQIAIVGKVLSAVCFGSILFISLRKKRIFLSTSFYNACFCISVLYFSFATTVHPWYILTPLIFSLLAENFIGLFWTFTIGLSYHFYGQGYTTTTYLLVGIEWGSLFLFWVISSKNPNWGEAFKRKLGLD